MTFRVGRLGRSVGRLGRWDWAWAQAGSVGPIEWVGLGPKGPVQVIGLKEGQTVTNLTFSFTKGDLLVRDRCDN